MKITENEIIVKMAEIGYNFEEDSVKVTFTFDDGKRISFKNWDKVWKWYQHVMD